MSIIFVGNSYSSIDKLSEEDTKALTILLSYVDKSMEYSLKQIEKQVKYLFDKRTQCEDNMKTAEYDSQLKAKMKAQRFLEHKYVVRLFDTKDNSFPTGLLSIVFEYFKSKNKTITVQDRRSKPKKYLYLADKIKEPPLRYYQEEIIQVCIKKSRATIEAATGVGKTRCLIEVIKEVGVRTLIICPTNNIVAQTAHLLKLRFGGKHVGVIGDSKRELDKDITVACVASLPNIDQKFFDDISCLIIDEAHHSSCDTILKLNKNKFTNIYHRFFFSGTMYRNDGADLALLGVVNTVDYRYPALQGIKDGFLAKPIFFIIDNRLQPCFHKAKYSTLYKKAIIENKQRNQYIVSKATKFVKAGLSVLILTNEIAHGKVLANLLASKTPEIPLKFICSMTQSNMRTIDKFNNKEIAVLIGTEVISEGVDTFGADILILASAGKARSETIQKIGRVLRPAAGKEFATIVDFSDKGNYIFENQSKARQEIYKEYQTTIEHIYLKNTE